jgi:outer membrane protein assembly factor BamB
MNKLPYLMNLSSTFRANLRLLPFIPFLANTALATGVSLSNDHILENLPPGTSIGLVSPVDQGESITATLATPDVDNDNSNFTLQSNLLKSSLVFDHETQETYTIEINVTYSDDSTEICTLTVTVDNVNEKPTSINISAQTVAENSITGTIIGDITVTDPDAGDTHTVALASSSQYQDVTLFKIENNQLVTTGVPNFEQQSSYLIGLVATDKAGKTYNQEYTINVTDVNEAPTSASMDNYSVVENKSSGTVVGNISVTDPDDGDTVTLSLPAGSEDNDSFSLAGNVLSTGSQFDFETKDSYTIEIIADDGALSSNLQIQIQVTDVQETPGNLALTNNSIPENQIAGTVVGVLTADDPDAGDVVSFALTQPNPPNNDNDLFTLDSSFLKTGKSFNFEDLGHLPTYYVDIIATDKAGNSANETFTNIEEPPYLIYPNSATKAENDSDSSFVETIDALDPEGDDVTLSLADPGQYPDNSFFVLTPALSTKNPLDYEAQSSYTVGIKATDANNLSSIFIFNVAVSDVNEPPTAISLDVRSIAENKSAGSLVGSFTATDPDAGDTHIFTLPAGAMDNSKFLISGSDLNLSESPDFETQSSYSISVRATDQGGTGLTFDKEFTILVTNINEDPTGITLSSLSVAENKTVGTSVGILSATDVDSGDTFTYSFVENGTYPDNSAFTIDGNFLKTAAIFDHEAKPSYQIRIQVTDSAQQSFTSAFTIAISDTNEPPTNISMDGQTIEENLSPNNPIGQISATDPEGDTLLFTLADQVQYPDNAHFYISGNDSDELYSKKSFNFEADSSYTVYLKATDDSGESLISPVVITVTPANDAPTAISLGTSTVVENQAAETNVGILSATDEDSGDTFTYSFVDSGTYPDNNSFSIQGNILKTQVSLDYEAKANYLLRIKVSDSLASYTQDIQVTVTDINELPSAISISKSSVAENKAVGTVVGTISVTDPDGDAVTIYLDTDTDTYPDNAFFEMDGTSLKTTAIFNYEDAQKTYNLKINAEDNAKIPAQFDLPIQISDANEAPDGFELNTTNLDENLPEGTVVGNLTASDPDAGDTHQFALSESNQYPDNGFFYILGSQLKTSGSLDHETQDSFQIRILAIDSMGASFPKTITILLNDLNEAPTDISLDTSAVLQGQDAGITVGHFSSTDQDEGDTGTFALTPAVSFPDNSSFSVEGSNLLSAKTFYADVRASYLIQAMVTDSGGLTYTKEFLIQVTTVAVSLSPASIFENQPEGTTVGDITATDPSTGNALQVTLVDNLTDFPDNAYFTLSQDGNNTLTTNQVFDFETVPSYQIWVQGTDSGGKTFISPVNISIADNNDSPTDITLSATTFMENSLSGTLVGTLDATDQDTTDTFTYALVDGGTDNASFSIPNGTNQLLTADTFDFEGAQQDFSIKIEVTDSPSGATYTKDFTITLTNDNEAPTIIDVDKSDVDENSPMGTVIGTLSGTDPDEGDSVAVYRLLDPSQHPQNEYFSIVGNQLLVDGELDFENQDSYTVQVIARDTGGQEATFPILINVNPVNEAPNELTLTNTTIQENQNAGTLIGTINVSDPEDNVSSIELSQASEEFEVVDNQLFSKGSLNFEVVDEYPITLVATDAEGKSLEVTFVITVTNMNEPPTSISLDNSSIDENIVKGTVGVLAALDEDPGDDHVFSLVSVDGIIGDTTFRIEDNLLKTDMSFNHETHSSYDLLVEASDGNFTVRQTIVVAINDVNEPPNKVTIDTAIVNENADIGTKVATLTGSDPDEGDSVIEYVLADPDLAPDNAFFSISGAFLLTTAQFDHETKDTYNLLIISKDVDQLESSTPIVVNIGDVNEPPTSISLNNSSIDENQSTYIIVSGLVVSDPDQGDSHVFSLPDGAQPDNSKFWISGSDLYLRESPDFETQSSYSISVQARDKAGNTVTHDAKIFVQDINEPPDILLDNSTIPENMPPRTIVGTLSATPVEQGDTHVFALPELSQYPDNSSFILDGTTLKTNMVFDAEAKSLYTLMVQATDIAGGEYSKEVKIQITNVNEPPNGIALSPANVYENSAIGTVIGTLSGSDPDVGDSHTYSLVDTANYPDNQAFAIDGEELLAAIKFDYETKDSYTIFIRVTDSAGVYFSRPVTVAILDAGDPPTQVTVQGGVVLENSGTGTMVGTLSAEDSDSSGPFSFALLPSSIYPANAAFRITGNVLEVAGSLDFEATPETEIYLLVTDDGGLSADLPLAIRLQNVPEPPFAISLDATGILENQPAGSIVGKLTASDPELTDSHTFALSTNAAYPSNSLFRIQGNSLLANQPFDYEAEQSLSVEILATDSSGLSFAQAITVLIKDIDEPPISISFTQTDFQMNPPPGTVLGTLVPYDPDSPYGPSAEALYYFPKSTEGPQNPSLKIQGDKVLVATTEGLLGKSEYKIRVRAYVQGSGILEATFSLHPRPFAPESLSINNTQVFENQATGSTIGTFSTTDIDGSDPHTYQLTNTVAYPDNLSFSISGNKLLVATPPDFESRQSFTIHVQVTDSFGLQFTRAIQLQTFDLNEPADTLLLDNRSFREGSLGGTLVGKIGFNDPDPFYRKPATLPLASMRWKFQSNGTILSTPAIGLDGTVFFGSSDNSVYALDGATGSQKWSFRTNGSVTSSPACGANGNVYFGSWDSYVYARDGNTGAAKWAFRTEDAVAASPTIGADGTIYIGSSDHHFYALDGASGTLKWKFKTGGAINSSAALGPDGKVYFGAYDRKFYALDSATGTKVWEFETGGWIRSSPALDTDGVVYFGSDDTFLYALDAQTGQKAWHFGTGNHVSSSPAVDRSGNVFIGSSDGYLYALNKKTRQVRWKYFAGGTITSPAINSDGFVHFGSSDGKLFVVYGHEAKLAWTYPVGQVLSSSAVIAPDGTIYIGSQDKSLYAVHGSSPPAQTQWPMKGGTPQHTGRIHHTYSLVSGNGSGDNQNFTVSGNQLLLAKSLDNLGTNSFNVRAKGISPGGLILEKSFDLSRIPAPVSAIAQDAVTIEGTEWLDLPWFGVFRDQGDGWIYHGFLGWLFPSGTQSSGGYWFWDPALGWIWTASGTYPHFYSTDHGWLFLNLDGKVQRQFYHWNAMEWKTW